MRRTYILLFVTILSVVLAVGCQGGKTDPVTDNNGFSDSETPYVLYDESGDGVVYLSEEHPEVIRVKSFVNEFVTEMNTLDFRSIDEDKAMPFLTQSMQEFTVEQKTWEMLFGNLREVEVVSKAEDIQIETAHFQHDLSGVYVLYTSTIRILQANEEKLALTNMTLGENRERAALHLILEDRNWKINGFGKLD
ncbi:MAG: hypothetical protein SCK29_03605 [Bacillota bacterium]|nr:hypothetical protein [Bacillota bacterium]MDW7683191.1 hypothetical protein [Bacillota bacterium]